MHPRVLVTGSSRGIGRTIAEKLATSGWKVALHGSRSSKELEEAAVAIGDSLAGVYAYDLQHPELADRLVEEVIGDGPLNAVVNNAGRYLPISFLESSANDLIDNYRSTFNLNFEAPLRICKAAVEHFEMLGGGRILNVASRVGFRGEAGACMYSASKAALINLTRALAVELALKNIQTFGIAPGWVDTAMARQGMDERLPAILEGIPLGRMASPEDCANAAEFLLSDRAVYLSGVVIDINGASYFH
ncbi:MAG TPA: SDR family oxidoreductase [Fimbriimonadaceae bacterium]|nr:SDR family oxidoreductase [Fimbriimonadaceae bacterium]